MKFSLAMAIAVLMLSASIATAAPKAAPASDYSYGSPHFTLLVADSYRQIHAPDTGTFYRWMNKDFLTIALANAHLSRNTVSTWPALLARKKAEVDQEHDIAQKTRLEMQDATWLHKTIKTALPHFSLTEGFEFSNAVRKGERQCVLQATLLASLLQSMDINAGLVMVYKNIAGESSNNGHAVTLMKCSDGTDILVDCSDPTPFVRHRGLFVADARSGAYRFMEPIYAGKAASIVGYHPDGETRKVANTLVKPLDFNFVRSQIEYYRGERTPGGLLSAKQTPAGLAAEAQHLRTSTAECPTNPLAQYMLGRVYIKQANLSSARRQLAKSYLIYERQGRVPQGCLDAMAEAKASIAKSSSNRS